MSLRDYFEIVESALDRVGRPARLDSDASVPVGSVRLGDGMVELVPRLGRALLAAEQGEASRPCRYSFFDIKILEYLTEIQGVLEHEKRVLESELRHLNRARLRTLPGADAAMP